MEITKTLKSKVCWIVMILSVFFLLLLMRDQIANIFHNKSPFISIVAILAVIAFFAMFALSLACTIRIIKDRFEERKKFAKESIWNLILYVVGFTTLQTCFLSGICGVNLVIPILSLFLPVTFIGFMEHYGLYILIAVDILLFISLYTMKCFKDDAPKKENIKLKLKV